MLVVQVIVLVTFPDTFASIEILIRLRIVKMLNLDMMKLHSCMVLL